MCEAGRGPHVARRERAGRGRVPAEGAVERDEAVADRLVAEAAAPVARRRGHEVAGDALRERDVPASVGGPFEAVALGPVVGVDAPEAEVGDARASGVAEAGVARGRALGRGYPSGVP